jgi:hypothetical protein
MYEGNELKHCVFTNKYHENKNSLLLSATIEVKDLEHEISLKDFSIQQSRGKFNQSTEYNQKIIDLVSKNLNVIRK